MNINQHEGLPCDSWSNFKTQEGAYTNSVVRQRWIGSSVKETIDGGDAERLNGSMIAEAVHQKARQPNSIHGYVSSNEKLALQEVVLRRVSMTDVGNIPNTTEHHQPPLLESKSQRSLITASSTKATLAVKSSNSRVQPICETSFLDMGKCRRDTSIDTAFQDKDMQATLEEYFGKERNSCTCIATQWQQQQRRRASTGSISQSANQHLSVADSTSTQYQRKGPSSTRTPHSENCRNIASPASSSNLAQEQRSKDNLSPPLTVLDAKVLAVAKSEPDPKAIPHAKARRAVIRKPSSSRSVASHHATIDDELTPDDDSASSPDTNKERCHLSASVRSSGEDSDSLDERTISLCEFFKGQLHGDTYSSYSRASSVCSDIQSDFDEDEHGSCSSLLFRPYVAGSGSGFMSMSGTSMNLHDEERAAVSEDGLPERSSCQPRMRRVGGCDEDEDGSCSSSLFRPYVAGSGSGFMSMSGTSMNLHDEERAAVSEDGLPERSSCQPRMRRVGGCDEDEDGSCSSALFRPYVAGSGSGFISMSDTSMDLPDEERAAVSEDDPPARDRLASQE